MRRYKEVWEYQELLLKKNTDIKLAFRYKDDADIATMPTVHHLLFVEHPPVYTLGKNGKESHVLISEEQMKERGIDYFHINRGGDI
ncbi:lipoyl protein ligase domain-containing protein, partial [Enterococcus lactis]|uniref:lipoyl protein ligase domain-containing protein n=1 Tax=Enterococcus lactis TaxID=357441 RepID=UPI0034E93329